MTQVVTSNPVAVNSPDHINPYGTSRDNSTNLKFVKEIKDKHGHPINFLDIGCSGGQLVVDFHITGNFAIGLEGSDYSVKHERANWPVYHNKILFTCDCSKPFFILDDDGFFIQFDVITAWEVIEHFSPHDLSQVFLNISNHLKPGGSFYGTINPEPDTAGPWHQSVFSKTEWLSNKLNDHSLLLDTQLVLKKYSLKEVVRIEGFAIELEKTL